MSAMLCTLCEAFCDTDQDPDGFYTEAYPNLFVCRACRDKEDLKTEFDDERDEEYEEYESDFDPTP